jgi:hypothetical protein
VSWLGKSLDSFVGLRYLLALSDVVDDLCGEVLTDVLLSHGCWAAFDLRRVYEVSICLT